MKAARQTKKNQNIHWGRGYLKDSIFAYENIFGILWKKDDTHNCISWE